MKSIGWIVACAALLSGCAHFQPYTGPATGASPADRLQVYRDFSFYQDERGILYAQGESVAPFNHGPRSPENYAKRVAPGLAYPRGRIPLLGRDAAWLGAFGGSILWWTQDMGSRGAAYAGAWVTVLGWLVDLSGRGEQVSVQDAEAFNEALAADLGLEAQPPLDTHPILRANDADRGWRFGLGSRFERISALDMQAYFTTSTWTPDWRYEDFWSGQQTLSAGYGWTGGWHFMAELDPIASRRYGIGWTNGDVADHSQDASALVARLGKAYTFMGSPHHQLSISPELSVGLAQLIGVYSYRDAGGNELGAYRYSAYAPMVGAGLRLAVPVGRSLALTLELGYDDIVFSSVPVTDSSGVFAGRSSPDQNWRGQPTVWDFSGPVIRFGTEFF
jgi:hypothetical protein